MGDGLSGSPRIFVVDSFPGFEKFPCLPVSVASCWTGEGVTLEAVLELRIAIMTTNIPGNATTQKPTAKAAELPVEAESVVMLLAMVGVACSTGGIDLSLTWLGELPEELNQSQGEP